MGWYRTRGLTQKQTKTATENTMFTTIGEPFTSESIAPEAIIDIVMRDGKTDTGRKLYTE